jgi:hypothetical protein
MKMMRKDVMGCGTALSAWMVTSLHVKMDLLVFKKIKYAMECRNVLMEVMNSVRSKAAQTGDSAGQPKPIIVQVLHVSIALGTNIVWTEQDAVQGTSAMGPV